MAGISRHWNLNSTESNLYENSDWFSGSLVLTEVVSHLFQSQVRVSH